MNESHKSDKVFHHKDHSMRIIILVRKWNTRRVSGDDSAVKSTYYPVREFKLPS